MAKSRFSSFMLVVAAIFGIGLLMGIVVPRWVGGGSSAKQYNTATLLLQVRTLSQLVTVQYVIEKIVVLEVPPDSMLGKMFAGENRVLMVAHGIVKGGIDFAKMKPTDIKVLDKTISI